jgi:hypothetical protein
VHHARYGLIDNMARAILIRRDEQIDPMDGGMVELVMG